MEHDRASSMQPPRSLKLRFLDWRNRVIGSGRFQRFAARTPLLRPIARRRASALFDLVAGFTYTQTLLAAVEAGIVERLAEGPASLADLAAETGLTETPLIRLLRAAEAIGIVEEGEPSWWLLGLHGAALQSNDGALAMIRHHRLLYTDLADPLALLADDDRSATHLSGFWRYGAGPAGNGGSQEIAAEYSQLMAVSQKAVAEQVLAAFPFARAQSLLDIGGGSGAFLRFVAEANPHLRLGLFDLPEVIDLARENAEKGDETFSPALHGGSFFSDPIPQGYEVLSLVRILHDHDDEPAQRLLSNIRRSMTPGTRLIIAEPMARTPGAEGMGDAYFGLYLWAMGSGRPRSAPEIQAMLEHAGFASSRRLRTDQPVVTSLIVAKA